MKGKGAPSLLQRTTALLTSPHSIPLVECSVVYKLASSEISVFAALTLFISPFLFFSVINYNSPFPHSHLQIPFEFQETLQTIKNI